MASSNDDLIAEYLRGETKPEDRPAGHPTVHQARRGSQPLIAEYLAQPDVDVPEPRPWYLRPFEKGADPRKLFTEGLPAAGRAFAETFEPPTHGQEISQRQPWTRRLTLTPSILHVGEQLSRVPTAIGRAAAELGPEKAKPLTEAMASQLPFMGGPKSLLASASPTYARYLASRQVKPLVTFPEQESLVRQGGPPAATRPPAPTPKPTPPGPEIPSFWPNPPTLTGREQGQLPGRLYTPQLPPRRLGEDLRSRTYFPEKTPYQAERPLEVAGGAREGELLDQYGRPVKGEAGPMTERERLRALHRSNLGQGARGELEKLEGRMRDVVGEAGGDYVGLQDIQGRPMYVVYNLRGPKDTTLYTAIDEATPQTLRRKLAEAKAKMEDVGPPGPSPKEVEGAYKASGLRPPGTEPPTPPVAPTPEPPTPAPSRLTWTERPAGLTRLAAYSSSDGRFLIEQKTPDRWVIQDKRARGPKGETSTFQEARKWAESRLGPEAPKPTSPPGPSPAGTSPAPFVEKTAIGDQAMIEGTEKRAIPTSKLLSTAPQSKLSESPLFAKPETAVQQPLGAAPSMADSIMAQLGPEAEKALASASNRFTLPPAVKKQLADMGIDAQVAMDVAKRRQTAQPPLEPPAPTAPRGQHYGKTVDVGTVNLTDPEEVRILLRDAGGINPKSTGLDVAATPKEFLNPKGANFDELVTQIAEAQGKKPKDVEREIGRTLSRYNTLKSELKEEGRLAEIRGAKPPEDIAGQVPVEEWQNMGPGDRRAVIEWFRDVFTDETGAMNLGAMVDAWKKFRRRLPMEEAVRKVVPDSPVISEVERWNVGLADGIKAVASSPWWKAVRKMNPEELKDLDQQMVGAWQAGGMNPAARARAIAGAPSHIRDAMARRDLQIQREQASRGFFGLDRIPEEPGPYLPRRTEAEAREAVSLGGGRLGVGRGLQTSVRGHQQERVFETYRQGEGAGTVYEDPRNAIIMREWEGLKLRATHRLFQNLEAKGVLYRDKAQAAAASPTGRPWAVENAPGGTWYARTEQEARFLEQNLTESSKGPTGSFVHYGNALVRNPSLVNPAPHIVKNMWAKALLARGPVGAYTVPRDALEYFRGTNPALIREFKDAMPFSSSGSTAGEILGNELRRGPVGEAMRLATRGLGLINKPSSRVIFEWADPAMRYALFKHYRNQGLSPYAAANHAWVDLIRYGTRSDLVDFWKAIPMNFFVPWRYGTLVSLMKQVKNHPVRTALLVAGIDYLREARYRSSGKWTHLPWDYSENPIAIVMQNAIDGKKDAKQQAVEALGIAATTRVFGPGGAFSAGQLVDSINDVRGRGDWERTKNMFWGISQLYNLKDEWKQFEETGDVKYLAEMVPTILLGEHRAVTYQPRRLMRDLPEWLPGLQKSPLVERAEQLQAEREDKARQYRERREQRPRSSIEDKLRESGYLR